MRTTDLRPGLPTTTRATRSAMAPATQTTRPSTASTAPTATAPTAADLAEVAAVDLPNGYEENAYALAEGKKLYVYFNCKGCHADGGGDIGPPLMDDQWIYGHRPAQVHATIVQGRPNGMPSFGGKIPDYQIWQLAAYVRSISGLVRKDAATGRSDHLHAKEPENSKASEDPKPSTLPPSSQRPG